MGDGAGSSQEIHPLYYSWKGQVSWLNITILAKSPYCFSTKRLHPQRISLNSKLFSGPQLEGSLHYAPNQRTSWCENPDLHRSLCFLRAHSSGLLLQHLHPPYFSGITGSGFRVKSAKSSRLGGESSFQRPLYHTPYAWQHVCPTYFFLSDSPLWRRSENKNSRWIVLLPLGSPFTKHLLRSVTPHPHPRFVLPAANVVSQKLTSRRFLAHSGATVLLAFLLAGSSCSETIAFGCVPTLNLYNRFSLSLGSKTFTGKHYFICTPLSSSCITT